MLQLISEKIDEALIVGEKRHPGTFLQVSFKQYLNYDSANSIY